MVKWDEFIPHDFEYDLEKHKQAVRGVSFEEARECFYSDYTVRAHKSYKDRYQLLGRTFTGRRLKVLFQLKPGNIVRIIIGWQI